MTHYVAAPNDSRYIPFTQQNSCCVPTSIQMIMYRQGIPLLPAEELGHHLGLVVAPEDRHLFYNARTAPEPPDSGYGTQIYNPQFEPNGVFERLQIPLRMRTKLAPELPDAAALLDVLRLIEADNADALLCFNHGVMRGAYEPHSGHVAVFDRVVDGRVRLVDASWKQPKWRLVEPELLHKAVVRHGEARSGGVWRFDRLE